MVALLRTKLTGGNQQSLLLNVSPRLRTQRMALLPQLLPQPLAVDGAERVVDTGDEYHPAHSVASV
ncbi:MAG: hypothetical protein H6835_19685 [Planctomycetes bacterium]|nr:hypothetical protein [Planctomycetota bacterium]